MSLNSREIYKTLSAALGFIVRRSTCSEGEWIVRLTRTADTLIYARIDIDAHIMRIMKLMSHENETRPCQHGT
jgi:hypothetical protein